MAYSLFQPVVVDMAPLVLVWDTRHHPGMEHLTRDRDVHKLGSFDPPVWAGAEVTNDEAFTGGALARLDGGGLDGILAPYR